METKQIPNIQKLTKDHENKWVAFSANYKKVVAVADTLRAVREMAGSADVVVMKVLPSHFGYAPSTRG